MRAIYAIYAGLVNPRRSYSQPSLPFALCPYAAGAISSPHYTVAFACPLRLCLKNCPTPLLFFIRLSALSAFFPLFCSAQTLSNQYAAKRRSLPVTRPLPLQRRAFHALTKNTPLRTLRRRTFPLSAPDFAPRLSYFHSPHRHSPPPHLSLIRPALRPTPTRHFRQNQQRKPTIFLPVCQQK